VIKLHCDDWHLTVCRHKHKSVIVFGQNGLLSTQQVLKVLCASR